MTAVNSMDDKVLVNVYLPASGQDYDVMVPRRLKLRDVTPMLAAALVELSGGSFIPSDDVAICDRQSGALLNINVTVDELGIRNGSKLMII